MGLGFRVLGLRFIGLEGVWECPKIKGTPKRVIEGYVGLRA